MNKIPTAEEFLKQNNVVGMTELMVPMMKEFAKLHVEAALKAAAKNAEMIYVGNPYDPEDDRQAVDEQSILNAYPKNLI